MLAKSPSTKVLGWEEAEACIWPKVDMVFSDDDLRGKLMPLWNCIFKYLDLAKASHKPPSSWGYAKVCLNHMECGGVTNGKWWAHVYSSCSPFSVSLATQAKRDMSTIIDTMQSGEYPCPPPPSAPRTATPQVIEMRPWTFHFQGLLPWGVHLAWVISPNVFSTTKWCQCKLTSTEILCSKDIPMDVISLLDARHSRILAQESDFVPTKCSLALLDVLLLDIADENGKSSFPEGSFSSPSSSQSSQAGESTFISAPAIDQDAELNRIKVATKSDDAEVPVFLWDERIQCTLSQEQKRRFLMGLHFLALCWWRYKVQHDFLSWFKAEHPQLLSTQEQENIQILNNEGQCVSIKCITILLPLTRILRSKKACSDWMADRDCVWHCAAASWWEWDAGSKGISTHHPGWVAALVHLYTPGV